jgi:hypothetical protein
LICRVIHDHRRATVKSHEPKQKQKNSNTDNLHNDKPLFYLQTRRAVNQKLR